MILSFNLLKYIKKLQTNKQKRQTWKKKIKKEQSQAQHSEGFLLWKNIFYWYDSFIFYMKDKSGQIIVDYILQILT